MPFGQHIEELRIHLLRAIMGVVAAFLVTTFFGNYVVRILASPVEARLEPYIKEQNAKRLKELVDTITTLPLDQQPHITMEATLSPEDLARLAERVGGKPPANNEPFTVGIKTSIIPYLEQLSVPFLELNRRWSLRTFSAQEPFVIYFKAVVGAALVIASPWIFYQIYSFIAVGLYAHERRFVTLSLPFSIGLFITGVLVCYFLAFPRMLDFFLWTNAWLDLEPEIRLNEWVGFSVILMLIFGLGFQLPLFMLLVERVGLLSYEWMAGQRRMAILVIAVVSAVATPGGDPMTMAFLAGPLYILFEIGLLLMIYFRRHNPFAAGEPYKEEIEADI